MSYLEGKKKGNEKSAHQKGKRMEIHGLRAWMGKKCGKQGDKK